MERCCLAAADEALKTCWFIVIHSRDQWWVDCEGKAYGPLASADEAIVYAKKIAVTFGDPNRRNDVWVAGASDRLELIWSGPDPSDPQ